MARHEPETEVAGLLMVAFWNAPETFTASDFKVFGIIFRRARDCGGRARVSQSELMAATGLSITGVINAVKRLVNLGVISQHAPKLHGHPYAYTLNRHALERLAAE